MNDIIQVWNIKEVSATVALFLLAIVTRWLLTRLIDRNDKLSVELKLKWSSLVRNSAFLIIIIGLVLIWAPQLRTLALSITAVAVAAVIATKELILCISGSLMKTGGNIFSIGDLIEIKSYKGFVINQNLWTTTLRELNSESLAPSGHDIILPNSLFLSDPVRNYSQLRPYKVHSFSVYLTPAYNTLKTSESILHAALQEHWRGIQNSEEFRKLTNSKKYY